jgi:UDP-N-acetylglucosamine 2-epimerase (non-hydrolysing)
MGKPCVLSVVGTRPDAIKSAPVILELRKYSELIRNVVVATGQHREMLRQALGAFGLQADIDLDIMEHGQTLSMITTRSLEKLDEVIAKEKPDYVFAQGDTTTTFVAALDSFYRHVPFGHIEAGLRTPTIDDPFPEEFNRRAASLVAKHHFAPTHHAAENLLREGHDRQSVFITGNTGIDAVLGVAEKLSQDWFPDHAGRLIVLTTHRRENWGEPQRRIARAARQLIDTFEDTLLVVPMHRNPQVREALHEILGSHARARLIEPPDYAPFVKLMQRCTLILSDSGGVQEEAPAFGKPVLVLRETTERPEGVEAGTAKLVGTDEATILAEAVKLLSNQSAYRAMAHAVSPYGDGMAAQRIVCVLLQHFGLPTKGMPMWAS